MHRHMKLWMVNLYILNTFDTQLCSSLLWVWHLLCDIHTFTLCVTCAHYFTNPTNPNTFFILPWYTCCTLVQGVWYVQSVADIYTANTCTYCFVISTCDVCSTLRKSTSLTRFLWGGVNAGGCGSRCGGWLWHAICRHNINNDTHNISWDVNTH